MSSTERIGRSLSSIFIGDSFTFRQRDVFSGLSNRVLKAFKLSFVILRVVVDIDWTDSDKSWT